MQTRESALHEWVKTLYPETVYSLIPLAGDASFRRYYRLQHPEQTYILMDAPPEKINMMPFVHVRSLLAEQGIHTPEIYAIDHTLGFALLEDFGDQLLHQALGTHDTTSLYQGAIQVLTQIHEYSRSRSLALPNFDKPFMLQELNLFHDWFLKLYLDLRLDEQEHQLLRQTFTLLTEKIAQQPQVFIHRDYHSRNIMLLGSTANSAPRFGILDFQDAMRGPITYDLVSLLKDCYVDLDTEKTQFWLHYFYEQSSLAQEYYAFSELLQAFDWCGLQRHLRILGTFSRLHLRDGKSNYLQDLPKTYQYVTTCLSKYPELSAFALWLEKRISPRFQEVLA